MKSFISAGFLRKLVPTARETMRNIFYDCIPVGGHLIVSFKGALHAMFELARTKTASSQVPDFRLFVFRRIYDSAVLRDLQIFWGDSIVQVSPTYAYRITGRAIGRPVRAY